MKTLGLSAFVGLVLGLGVIWWLDDPGESLNGGAVTLILLFTCSASALLGAAYAWLRRRDRSSG